MAWVAITILITLFLILFFRNGQNRIKYAWGALYIIFFLIYVFGPDLEPCGLKPREELTALQYNACIRNKTNENLYIAGWYILAFGIIGLILYGEYLGPSTWATIFGRAPRQRVARRGPVINRYNTVLSPAT